MAASCSATAPAPEPEAHWRPAWGAAQNVADPAVPLDHTTLRMAVEPSIAGSSVRVQLGNVVGTDTARIHRAYVGVASVGASTAPGSNQPLTFDGTDTVDISAGETVWSDPLDMTVTAGERLLVSIEVLSATTASTHTLGLRTNYLAPGFVGDSESSDGYEPIPARATGTDVDAYPVYFVSAVDVRSSDAAAGIVAFGDSITDGRCSTTTEQGDGTVLPDINNRWTDVLSQRLTDAYGPRAPSISNEGIAGNRIVAGGGNGPAAVSRYTRDVLDREGVTHVIFFEGTNDIFYSDLTVNDLIAATTTLIDQTHARGIKIIGATLIPRGRPATASTTFTADKEATRLAFNDWIENTADFDGVIDFDAVFHGGGTSESGALIMNPAYDCGDFTHPNSDGYRAMGEAIDLTLFD